MAEKAPSGPVERGASRPRFVWLYRLCLISAGAGGLAAFAAALMVTLSVLMRIFGFGGIRGDFEAVELVCAACASLFLPYCQFTKGHVMVDLFTNWLSAAGQNRLDGFWTVLFGLGWSVICWRLTHGLETIYGYGDRTMLLGFPVWMIYLPAVAGTGLSALVAFVTGIDDLVNARAPAPLKEGV